MNLRLFVGWDDCNPFCLEDGSLETQTSDEGNTKGNTGGSATRNPNRILIKTFPFLLGKFGGAEPFDQPRRVCRIRLLFFPDVVSAHSYQQKMSVKR